MFTEREPESEKTPTFPERLSLSSAVGGEEAYSPIVGSSGMGYRLLEELGEGGMARVFLACGVGSGGFTKIVVLKMLRKKLAEDPAIRQMFQAEARLCARLRHPNLVQVHEVVEGNVPFLVMEYLDGKPLSSVRVGEGLTQRMLVTIISEALVGLHHAHELCDYDGTPLNIVHRDISPHNIFLTYDGVVKLLDFGIAKMASSSSHTETGEIKGKLGYMAPEQLLGEEIDRRADIFSVGCMLWEAAVGRRLWDTMPEARVMHQLATGDIPQPGEQGVTIDPALERIIVKATAAKPADRYATAMDLQHDLTAFLALGGAACSMRDIGAALAESFKEQRARHKEALAQAFRDPSKLLGETGAENKTGRSSTTLVVQWSRRPALLAALLATLLLSGGAVVWGARAATPKVEHAAVSTPALVSIHIHVAPPEATIDIDGTERGTETVTLSVNADKLEHSLRASAPGYLPQRRMLKFDRNLDLEIRLDQAVVPAEPVASASALEKGASAPRRLPPKRKSNSPTEPNSCNPPYYFANGVKTYRPECLLIRTRR